MEQYFQWLEFMEIAREAGKKLHGDRARTCPPAATEAQKYHGPPKSSITSST
jgi:hypothetical protein